MFIKFLFLSLSTAITFLFFIYGYNSYYLLAALRRYKNPPRAVSDPSAPSYSPRVAIHLPVYNEKYVVGRLVEACALMAKEYGPDKVRIVVIDDSDDDTTKEAARVRDEQEARGIRVEIIHRRDREGFKAGALQLALQRSQEELIAIFDADFIPPVDFLTATVPYFEKDAGLGIIQSRWDHINGDFNFITRAISIGIDVHFLIEQPARFAAGCFLNFNGSGGIIRREALVKAGGWQSDTLAEDLDVSYRMQLEGYRVLYLKDLRCRGEVPPTLPSYKKQQARWACGSLRTAKKLLPRLLAVPNLGSRKKLQSFIHLTYYIVHPLMFFSFLLSALAAVFNIDCFASTPSLLPHGVNGFTVLRMTPSYLMTAAIIVCTVAVWLYPVVALRARGQKFTRRIPSILILGLIGFGVSLSNTIEAGKALLSRRAWPFTRTPKYDIREAPDQWKTKKYQVPFDGIGVLEIASAVLGAVAVGITIGRSMYWPILIIAPYTLAFGFVSFFTFLQSRKREAA